MKFLDAMSSWVVPHCKHIYREAWPDWNCTMLTVEHGRKILVRVKNVAGVATDVKVVVSADLEAEDWIVSNVRFVPGVSTTSAASYLEQAQAIIDIINAFDESTLNAAFIKRWPKPVVPELTGG